MKDFSAPSASAWRRRGKLWQCPACRKLYPRAGQSHSCGKVSLVHHFRNRPRARVLFDAYRQAVEEIGGPVRLSIAKTRIGLIAKITFSAVMPRKEHLRCHILLPRRIDSPRFLRIDDGPPYWVHHFEIRDESDLNQQLRGWLRESMLVGKDT